MDSIEQNILALADAYEAVLDAEGTDGEDAALAAAWGLFEAVRA